MKAVLALAASLSLASASLLPRQFDQIPPCALTCALGSLQSTGCQTTDFACICQATAFISSLLPCVQAGCSQAEIGNTIQAAEALCLQASVTLVVPTGASTAPPSSTEAPSTETEASTTAPPSTETSAGTTSAQSTTEAPATTSTSGNGTQTGTRPPTPTGTEPGAASRNTVALGGLGAIVALVAAFL